MPCGVNALCGCTTNNRQSKTFDVTKIVKQSKFQKAIENMFAIYSQTLATFRKTYQSTT